MKKDALHINIYIYTTCTIRNKVIILFILPWNSVGKRPFLSVLTPVFAVCSLPRTLHARTTVHYRCASGASSSLWATNSLQERHNSGGERGAKCEIYNGFVKVFGGLIAFFRSLQGSSCLSTIASANVLVPHYVIWVISCCKFSILLNESLYLVRRAIYGLVY